MRVELFESAFRQRKMAANESIYTFSENLSKNLNCLKYLNEFKGK